MKIFVPGRICLMGEHSDWAGGYRRINADIEKGYALIAGTNQGIFAEVEAHRVGQPPAVLLQERVVEPELVPDLLDALGARVGATGQERGRIGRQFHGQPEHRDGRHALLRDQRHA